MPSKFLGSKILFLLVLMPFASLLIWLFWFHDITLKPGTSGFSSYEMAGLIVGLLQALIYALTLLVISHQITVEYGKNKKNITIQAMTNFLDFKYELNDSLKLASIMTNEDLRNIAKTHNLTDEKKELRKSIGRLLDRCEHLAVCINDDLYDINFINKVGGGLLVKMYTQFQPYMEEIRVSTGNHGIYTQFQKIHTQLRQMRSDQSGRIQK